MREMILFFVVFFLCLGSACADTYVSKENPNYAIDYITSGGQVFGVGECKEWSRQRPQHVGKCRSFLAYHFYYQGEIVDSKIDEMAKKNYLKKI